MVHFISIALMTIDIYIYIYIYIFIRYTNCVEEKFKQMIFDHEFSIFLT